jgi:hypothetical protein
MANAVFIASETRRSVMAKLRGISLRRYGDRRGEHEVFAGTARAMACLLSAVMAVEHSPAPVGAYGGKHKREARSKEDVLSGQPVGRDVRDLGSFVHPATRTGTTVQTTTV